MQENHNSTDSTLLIFKKILIDNCKKMSKSQSFVWFQIFLWLTLFFQVAFVSFIREGTSFDGAEQLLYTQYLDFGYGRSQPPLYTWLLLLFQEIFGVSIFAENLLKYILIGVAFSATQSAASKIWNNRLAGVLSAATYLLVPEIIWEMQRNYAHSVLLLTLTALMFTRYFVLLDNKSAINYATYGGLLGLMLLSKYNSAIIIGALALSDVLIMRRTGAFGNFKIIISISIAILVTLPHFIWAISHLKNIIYLSGSFSIAPSNDHVQNLIDGLVAFAAASVGLLAFLICTLFFSNGWRATIDFFTPRLKLIRNPTSVVFMTAVLFLFITLAFTLFASATNIRPRWLLPAVVPFAISLGGLVAKTEARSVRRFLSTGAVVVVLTSIGLFVEEFRPNARTAFDYNSLENDMSRSLSMDAVVFSEYQIFANLRLSDRNLILVDPVMPFTPSLDNVLHPYALWTGEISNRDSILTYAQTLGLKPAPNSSVKEFELKRWNGYSRQIYALELSRFK